MNLKDFFTCSLCYSLVLKKYREEHAERCRKLIPAGGLPKGEWIGGHEGYEVVLPEIEFIPVEAE